MAEENTRISILNDKMRKASRKGENYNEVIFNFNIFNWRIIVLQCCVSGVQQCEFAIRIYIAPPSGASLPPPPILPLCVIAEHPAELPVLDSSFP